MIQKRLRVLLLCVLGTIMACSNAVSPDANASDKLSSSSSLKLSSSVIPSSSSSSSFMRDEVSENLGTVSALAVAKNVSGSWFLTWSYASGDIAEEGFQIDFFNESKNVWESFDSVAANTNRYVFSTKKPGAYRVSAFNANSRSNFSNDAVIEGEPPLEASASDDIGKVSALAVAKNASGSWFLTWSYASGDVAEEGFQIDFFNESKNIWESLDSVPANTSRYVFSTKIPGAYRVSAFNANSRSNFSNDAVIEGEPPLEASASDDIGKVSALAVAKNASGSWFLTWSYASGDVAEEGFQIDFFNESKNVWESFDSVPANTSRYVFSTKKPGAYRVSAFNANSRSNFSNDAVIEGEPSTEVSASDDIGKVSALGLSKNSSGMWFLIWSYASGDVVEDGFQIDAFNDSKNNWEAFDTVPANTYRYTFETSRAGVYRVSAFKADIRSNFSNDVEVGAEPSLTDLPKPTALTAKRLAPSVWQLSWAFTTSVDRRESGFILQKYDASAQNWVVWDTLSQDVKRVVLDSVVAGVDLSIGSYRIAAYDSLGRSGFSNDIEISIQTKYDENLVFVPPIDIVPNVVVPGYLELVIPMNPMNKSVEQSIYTQELSYEVIWVAADTEYPEVPFSYSKNSVRYTVVSDELCNSYGRIRLVWTDVNGIIDYSEWSVPVGSKPGTHSKLVDNKDTPNCSEIL